MYRPTPLPPTSNFFFFFLFPSKLACFFLLLIYPSLPRSSVFSLSISITVLGVCEALPGHQPQNAIRSHHTTSLCSRKHFLVHSFPPHTAIPNHYIKPSPRAEHQQVSGSSPNNSPLMSSLLIRFYLSICHLDVTFPSSLATQVSLLPSNSLCISSCPPSKCCLTAAVQTVLISPFLQQTRPRLYALYLQVHLPLPILSYLFITQISSPLQ